MKEKYKYLKTDEIEQFFDYMKRKGTTRDYLLFLFTYRYALRMTEALMLKLTSFEPDVKNPIDIKIERLKNGIGRHYPVKTADARLLKKWLKERKNYQYSDVNPYVFISRESGATEHMSYVNVAQLLQRYSKVAGLAKIESTTHVFRHSRAIDLLMKGFDILFVKNFLGQKSLASVLVYTLIAPPEWKRQVSEAFEKE